VIDAGDTTRDLVILVDERDRPLGTAPKLDVHRDGRLHRAVSVVLVDSTGQILLQRRAATKYHSPNLWSNTCCGHPTPGESVTKAARRRLLAEMGISDCELTPTARFVYRAPLAHGLFEHELDHLFVGRWNGEPVPNPGEVSEWRWMSVQSLRRDLELNGESYTAWLTHVLARLKDLV
jgi:isopentenyl-diphosphate Delta-isomerase